LTVVSEVEFGCLDDILRNDFAWFCRATSIRITSREEKCSQNRSQKGGNSLPDVEIITDTLAIPQNKSGYYLYLNNNPNRSILSVSRDCRMLSLPNAFTAVVALSRAGIAPSSQKPRRGFAVFCKT
jgi:hypothetical protein